jgi:hypothetical protein
MSRLVWRFQPCPPYPPCQSGLTRMPGWSRWIRRCICVMWAGMAAPMSIWPPTTSVLRWPDGASSSRWKRRVASVPFGTRTRLSSCFPFPGLVGQQMALADYLQYILQEALAAPRRSSARRGRQSPTAASLGGGSLISSFIRQLSQALALIGASAGKLLSLGFTKTRETRNHLLHEQSLCLIAPSSSSHPAFFSLPSQLFPVLPQPFR